MLNKLPTLLLLLILSSTTHAQLCPQKMLSANYEVTFSSFMSKKQKNLELWRNGNHVAHHYPQTQITEYWFLNPHKQIQPIRFFDKHQRAIEYQVGESVHGKSETDWSYRYQMIADGLLQSLQEKERSGSGCDQQITYSGQQGKQLIQVVWMPEQKLIKSFTLRKGNAKETWKLIGVNADPDRVTQFFKHRDKYQSTDFADIGDDHTDPFLTNMVTLGFIEHGASGFYDDKGNPIRGGLHRH